MKTKLAHPFRIRYGSCMTITLKNVPAQTHRTLKKQAKLHKRSLNQEAITCIEAQLNPIRADTQAIIDDAIKFRRKLAARGFKAMTQKELRVAINEGRE
jgi:plasmid stability protein